MDRTLGNLALTGEHQPRQNQRLRPRPTLDQPPLDEHLIDALFGHPGSVAATGLADKTGFRKSINDE